MDRPRTRLGRYPAGLLELLGSKSDGVNPYELSETVNGVVDLAQMLARYDSQTPFVRNAAATFGTAVTITVPANEWWIIQAMSATIIEQVAMTALATQVAVNGVIVHWLENLNIANALPQAGASFVSYWTAPYPMLLPPGSELAARICKLGGVPNCDITLNALIGRLS